jgi:anaerobic selenocysteine-containing dehydrogenase
MKQFRKIQDSIRRYDQVRRSTCVNCPTGCGLKFFLNKGKVVDIWGDEDHPLNKGSTCTKGLIAGRYLNHPLRLKYPMIRGKTSGEFGRTSWGKALDFVVERLEKVRHKYGSESLCIHVAESFDFGNNIGAERFGKLYLTPNVFDSFSGIENACHDMFSIKGSYVLMNPQYDWPNSKCMLIVDSDPAASDPVLMNWIINAQERGTKIITIDSRDTVTMSKSDVALRVRPGTQAILLLGMVNFIIENDLYDLPFIQRWVAGFQEWREVARDYPLEKVENITGIPGNTITGATRLFATLLPSQIISRTSTADKHYSLNLVRACAELVCLTGCVGVAGGGLNILDNIPPFNTVNDIDITKGKETESNSPVSNSLYSLVTRERHPVKALIWTGNVAAATPFQQRFKQMLAELELIVHLSYFPDSTYHLSHVSFPMASWVESEGLVYRTNSRSLQWHNRIVEPDGECQSFIDFWSMLSEGFGWQKWFPWRNRNGRIDTRQMIDFFLAEEELTAGITADLLDPEKNPPGGIMWPCMDVDETGYEAGSPVRGKGILFKPGERFPGSDRRFPTSSGKIEITSARLKSLAANYVNIYDDPNKLAIENADLVQRFPMILGTGTTVDYIQGLGYWLSRGQNTMAARLYVQIHPKIARLLEIKISDIVVVENDRGSIEGPCWINQSVSLRSVWCPEGADEFQPLFPYQSANGLMDDIADTKGQGQVNSDLRLVRIYLKGTKPQDAVDKLNSFFKGPRWE